VKDSPSTTTDALCRDCAHMVPDADGNRFCFSPQIMKAYRVGSRCVFERDDYPEPVRSHLDGTGKCGPQHLNFERRKEC
jgi:hypothetical protein